MQSFLDGETVIHDNQVKLSGNNQSSIIILYLFKIKQGILFGVLIQHCE